MRTRTGTAIVTDHRRMTVYWTQRHEKALLNAAQAMKDRGIPCERDGKPNISQIIAYALEQLGKSKR